MRLLDLFCGAGGAAMGYYRAGFKDITGIDNRPMPRYPFEFVQGDALEYLEAHGREYDVIHASPPCQAYSAMQHIHKNQDSHPDLVGATRELLEATGKPWIIENVPGAPIRVDVMLCGTMFGLQIIRHRWFECSSPVSVFTPTCNHTNVYDPYHGGEQARGERVKLANAMGLEPFMKREEVRNAIPPAYTEWIGKQLMKAIA